MISLLLGIFTLIELNCENLFDCQHDTLKHDTEWLSDGARRWNSYRYWNKINSLAKVIISCGDSEKEWNMPDIAVLCEVENDSLLRDLTKRSLLRTARYEYVITQSPDERGMDVAILYSPLTFKPLNFHSIRIKNAKNERPTRDVLYLSGCISTGDTLHIFALHAPSRVGGVNKTDAYRLKVAQRIMQSTDSIKNISQDPKIIIAGDFNDLNNGISLQCLADNNFIDVSKAVKGKAKGKATYKYKGVWQSLDHIFISQNMQKWLLECRINDADFLLEEDKKYGGWQPKRTYNGYRYNKGYSDHLPLVVQFLIP